MNVLLKSQLFKLLNKRSNIDTTKTLIIHYNDSLKSPNQYSEKGETKYMVSFGHEHLNTYKGFLIGHKNCLRRHNKYKKIANVLHFYITNNGHPSRYKKLFWYKDYGSIIKKMFSDSYKNFDRIIIHPNGEFYLGFQSHRYENLIKKKDWDEYRDEFVQEVNKTNQY